MNCKMNDSVGGKNYMAIYKAEEYPEILERIKQKVKLCNIKMGDTLSENEIQNFEQHCNITLPAAYRLFLKEIGSGCKMIDGYQLHPLEKLEWEDLSYPFLLKEAWIWENEEVIAEQLEVMVYRGNIELIDIGDGNSYHLIVSGECAGEVWNFTDIGAQPCCERQDFLGWFERWLDERDNVDYFREYLPDEEKKLPIPRHLQEIFRADMQLSDENHLEGIIKCTCGCSSFKIKTFSSSYRQERCIHVKKYKNGFALVLYSVCESCSKEWLLFDLSKHGYDGFVCHDGIEIAEDTKLKVYQCLECDGKSFGISFGIEVEDKEQFIEEVADEFPDEYVEEDYVDAFNWLTASLECRCCKGRLKRWLDIELS